VTDRARVGWESTFAEFREAQPKRIRERIKAFIKDASPEQIRAWDDTIPPLQAEVSEVLIREELARHYSAILEYELPMESRRPDVLLLVGACVMVIELTEKGLSQPGRPRSSCGVRPGPSELPSRVRGPRGDPGARADASPRISQLVDGVHVTGPDALDALVDRLTISRRLRVNAYRVLLTRDVTRR